MNTLRSPALAIAALAASLALPAQNWTMLPAAANSPAARLMASATRQIDATGFSMLLHGGATTLPGTATNDTWTFDGTTWTDVTPGQPGPSRAQSKLVFDVARNRAVLYGGWQNSPTAYETDTWEWDPLARTWTTVEQGLAPGVTSPTASASFAMCYAENVQRTILFGGLEPTTPILSNETWEWDGTAWTEVTTTGTPPPHFLADMEYDPRSGLCVLFGGIDITIGPSSNTWVYDPLARSWQQLMTRNPPPARTRPLLEFDAARNVLVMVGGEVQGATPVVYDDVWEFDGADWCEVFPATPLPPHELTLDPVLGSFGDVSTLPNAGVVRFGGGIPPGGMTSRETWTYGGAGGYFCTYGAGCPGAVGVPRLVPQAGSAPTHGTAFALDVVDVPAGALTPAMLLGFDGVRAAGIDLALLGAPAGCELYANGGAIAALPLPGAGTTRTLVLPIPPAPTLAGASLILQAILPDATVAAPLQLVTSDGGQAIIH